VIRRRTQSRECALQMLYQYEINPEPLADLFMRFWPGQEEKFPQDIRDFTEMLVRGVIEHQQEIDQIISRYADNWELHRMAIIDRNIMRFAAYELLYLSDVPPKVSINEAVNLAKKFSQEESGKFVNGILDKINHTEAPRNPKKNVPSSR